MRNLSNDALRNIFEDNSDDIFYVLLTIDPDVEGVEPIRAYNSQETENGEPRVIKHNGFDFVAYPFTINLPGEGIDTSTELTLTIANVDRSITETVRQYTKPMLITLEVVLSSHTDITEAGPFNMKLTNIKGTALTIEGTIIADRFLNESFPALKFDASVCPALF